MSVGLPPLSNCRNRPVTLKPPWYGPPMLGCTAVFLAFLGQAALSAGGVELGWRHAAGYWSGALAAGIAAVVLFRRRHGHELTVSSCGFQCGPVSVPRECVARIRRYKDLSVNSVRIELLDGSFADILAVHHDPQAVLSAFRDNGYPIQE
jgi:hypothetical protein